MNSVTVIALAASCTVAALLGYWLGRRRSEPADTRENDHLKARLAAEAHAAEAARTEVTQHFETSAALLGQLARDYRALLDNFVASAKALGLSDDFVETARSTGLVRDGATPDPAHDASAATHGQAPSPSASQVHDVELPIPAAEPEDSRGAKRTV